ncbi:hypothetical protein BLNAU_24705 [Blattamonas nauphoetae]|uniref:Protein kinase domain-containing protein n=1 Tax=Blattamonas nauphoetae TaxID=2049346 RepID=A0ABQ9WLR9_9EUKA|nr:hypothetical protein BLNAU_24705 [Blattamonas nauphoetae]
MARQACRHRQEKGTCHKEGLPRRYCGSFRRCLCHFGADFADRSDHLGQASIDEKKNNQSLLANENSTMEMDEVIVKEEEDVPDSTLNRMMNREGSIVTQSRQPILCKADTENQTCSDDPFHPPSEMVVRDIPESMQRDAIQCVHPFDTKVVSCADSLFCRLHGRENERKGSRGREWRVLLRMASSNFISGIPLITHSPHSIHTESCSTMTQSASFSAIPPKQLHLPSTTIVHLSHSTHPSPQTEERWEAPEVRKDEEQPKNEYDQAKACVFSLGLVMFEMVTMTVPFGEVDGVNAHRQIMSGSLPDLSKIEDDSTRDLISSCLSFNPNERPSLSSLSDSLNELAQTDQSAAALPSHKIVQ